MDYKIFKISNQSHESLNKKIKSVYTDVFAVVQADVGGLQVRDQPAQPSKNLSQTKQNQTTRNKNRQKN